MIRTLLVLEGRLISGALALVLSAQDDIEVIGDPNESVDIETTIAAERPDVAVVDLNIISVARLLKISGGRCRILALAESRKAPQLATVMTRHSGEIGFLGHASPPQRVIDSVRMLARGQMVLDGTLVASVLRANNPFTTREAEILSTAAEGVPVHEIATKFGLTPGTIRNHLSRIVAKSGARNRIQAVRRARESGWI